MKAKGLKPLRTIHISFVPDEEIGGADGMGKFINSQEVCEYNATQSSPCKQLSLTLP